MTRQLLLLMFLPALILCWTIVTDKQPIVHSNATQQDEIGSMSMSIAEQVARQLEDEEWLPVSAHHGHGIGDGSTSRFLKEPEASEAMETLIDDLEEEDSLFAKREERAHTQSPTPDDTPMETLAFTQDGIFLFDDFLSSMATYNPSEAQVMPTARPSTEPSPQPTQSRQPSDLPSNIPSFRPSVSPQPSSLPSDSPSNHPTRSMQPSATPSVSLEPTITAMPSDLPSDVPSDIPSYLPTLGEEEDRDDVGLAMLFITDGPSESPSFSSYPSVQPSNSINPSQAPTEQPSTVPTISMSPSQLPTVSFSPTISFAPSFVPSKAPSYQPSSMPSVSSHPSLAPTAAPSALPSDFPSSIPSLEPSLSNFPSVPPSSVPSFVPSKTPSEAPSEAPSAVPSTPPSSLPSTSPSSHPSSAPSSAPTLVCHDKPDYRSPFNKDFECKHHVGSSCLKWRHFGLTLDDLEQLIISCPVSCNIDCGAATRYDVAVSYQVSRVPGLLDADTVDDLNEITKEYLIDFVRVSVTEPTKEIFVDNVELLSQTILSRGVQRRMITTTRTTTTALVKYDDTRNNNNVQRELEGFVNLWVTVAIRGFAFNLTVEDATTRFINGVDSVGYSSSIQNEGNEALSQAYAFSAKADDKINPLLEEVPEDGNGSSAAIVVVVVVFILVVACAAGAYIYHKQNPNGLRKLLRYRRKRKVVVREVQSPESQNVASHVGSMFSFDDSATAGTNGLMRYISSFSRSKESTSPGSSAQDSYQNDLEGDEVNDDDNLHGHDEELGPMMTPTLEEDESSVAEEEEPHPLTGIIPPMIVYDHIDGDTEHDLDGSKMSGTTTPKQRGMSVVPSRRVEASSSFKAVLENRHRPSATNELAEYLRETSNFTSDPSLVRWNRLESRRPSPIGIVMDSDDEISIASTPARPLSQPKLSIPKSHRKARSLDDRSILESLSDIIVSEHDYGASVSPIELPALSLTPMGTPGKIARPLPAESPPPVPNSSPSSNANTSLEYEEDPDPSSGDSGTAGHPETPRLTRGNSSRSLGSRSSRHESKSSFWNRSPIAKGVKDAIWTKRANTNTPGAQRYVSPATPTRQDIQPKRFTGAPPSTPPTRTDVPPRRNSMHGHPSTPPTRTDSSVRRPPTIFPPPTTPTSRPEFQAVRRSSTPTRIESFKRMPTPPRADQPPRRSSSPTSAMVPVKSNSEESHGESRRSLRSGSNSFGTAQESLDEEHEFRAQRIGKLGMVINTSPTTGPYVEQVKDYSTLFGRILAGDRIIEVDGLDTTQMTIKEVTKRLSGKYGIRATSNEVRIKIARTREREWSLVEEEDHRSVNSVGSSDSFQSEHRRNHSEPEPLLERLSLNSNIEHRLSSNSYSNTSRSGEEV